MQGRYFQDFNVGDKLLTPSRTISQEDILAFARLSGDNNPIHVDSEFAARTRFARPIAHGLLVVSCLSGLIEQLGLYRGTVIAMRRIIDCGFYHPVYAGDSICAELCVVDKTERNTSGTVGFSLIARNQKQEIVIEMRFDVKIAKR